MTRREMREHTFRLLFLKEFYNEEDLGGQVRLYLEEFEDMPEEAKEELGTRVRQIYARVEELDGQINDVAEGWKTRRMGKVDLTIIRLALYEILHDDAVPEKVAINEAVELAKKFGGDDSPSFINGVLGKLVRRRA
ncbi:MAG: transcription antitermination factor NusB [Lachnospiraceae bacterium]|nr:transcription antitermination factor NusB [Lachnospiraceae bacterium]